MLASYLGLTPPEGEGVERVYLRETGPGRFELEWAGDPITLRFEEAARAFGPSTMRTTPCSPSWT